MELRLMQDSRGGLTLGQGPGTVAEEVWPTWDCWLGLRQVTAAEHAHGNRAARRSLLAS